jgi:hypothetical protein
MASSPDLYIQPTIGQLRDVVIDGASVETLMRLWQYDFCDLLDELKVLEQNYGFVTPTHEQMQRIKRLLRASVDLSSHRKKKMDPDWLLRNVILLGGDIWQNAWVVEFLIVECGAGIYRGNSKEFLYAVYRDYTPADVRNVCYHHWNLLLERGLDVNGWYNGGETNILASYITDSNVIERALERGADPNMRHATPSIGVLEKARRDLETCCNSYLKKNILRSMALLKAAQNARLLDRLLKSAPSMARFSTEIRQRIVSEGTGGRTYDHEYGGHQPARH